MISKSDRDVDDEKLIKDALSLQHAVKSHDDIDQLKHKADRTAALARLSAQVDRVYTNHKVYMDGLIEGRLHKNRNGNLVIYPVVERHNAAVVTREHYESTRKAALRNYQKVKFMKHLRIADDDSANGDLTPWKPTLSSKAREKYLNKRRDPDQGGPRIKGFLRRRKKLNHHESIAEQMKTVIDEQSKRDRRLRRLIMQRRRDRKNARQAAVD